MVANDHKKTNINNLKIKTMAQFEKDKEQTTKYSIFNHREYGNVIAVDVTTRFLKEYLTARMYLESLPLAGDCDEECQRNRKIIDEKIMPFFTHMDEILDTL